MATSFPGPQDDGVKTQAAPKMLLGWRIAGVIIIGIITGYVLLHNHGGSGVMGSGGSAGGGSASQNAGVASTSC